MHLQPLDIRAALALIEALDGSREDLDKVLRLERLVYEKMNS